MKGGSMEMSGNILGLKMESNGIRVIEPFDMAVKYSNASGKTNLHLLVSEIYMNFSFSILRLFLAVEEEISAFLRMSSKKMSLECYQFDKIATVQGTRKLVMLVYTFRVLVMVYNLHSLTCFRQYK
jgi:vacuolar protein sorting-associated protein 13A/C